MTQEQNRPEAAEALAALNSIRATREEALGRMDYWSWWYDAGYALSCGLLVGGQGLGTAIGMACTALALAILIIIMRRWQAETGVWVNGYSPRRARWAAFGLAALLMGLLGLSLWFGRVQDMVWVPLACGVVAGVLGLIGMRVWMHLYRRDVKDLA